MVATMKQRHGLIAKCSTNEKKQVHRLFKTRPQVKREMVISALGRNNFQIFHFFVFAKANFTILNKATQRCVPYKWRQICGNSSVII